MPVLSTPEGRKWSNLFFGVLFALSILLFGRIIWPFVLPVLLGAFGAVLFMPFQDFLAKRLGSQGRLSAALSTVTVFLLILVPLGIMIYLAVRELLGAVNSLSQSLADPAFLDAMLDRIPASIRQHLPGNQLPADTANTAVNALAGSATAIGGILSQSAEIAVDLFLMVLSLYYFFLDGRRLVKDLVFLVPMDARYSWAFVREFKDVTYAIMWGHTLTALIQGVLGTLGLFIAQVSSPLLWGSAMVVTSLIPVGGTALVWVPVSMGLLLTHHVRAGIFLLAWGILVISMVDNLLRPRLTGARMQMHPLLMFLSMFGGLSVVGVMGLAVGPLVAGLMMSMIRIYRRDFLSEAIPATDPQPKRA